MIIFAWLVLSTVFKLAKARGGNVYMDPFRERIEALLRDGKISSEEAAQLRGAMDSSGETTERPLTGSNGTGSLPIPPIPPAAAAPNPQPDPQPQPKPQPKPQPSPTFNPTTPKGTANNQRSMVAASGNFKRLRLEINAGDIDIEGVEGSNEIRAEGDNTHLNIKVDGDGVRIDSQPMTSNPTEMAWLDTVFQAIGRFLPVTVKLKVPANLTLVEVRALAGDIDVKGVHGRVDVELQAGDVNICDASSFRVQASAGDIDVQTQLTGGESSVKALAGDVDINLEPGSSVALNASNSAGDISARGFILTHVDKRITGGSLTGTLGDGRARLEVHLSAGDVDILAK
jgi:hypothetical protein